MYKRIDLESFERRQHFEYFKNIGYPYVGITANLDISGFMSRVRKNNLPFFLSFLYCACNAANSVREFRMRIDGDSIVEFSRCDSSHTVALPDGTYCYCRLRHDMPYTKYLDYASAEQEKAKSLVSLDDGEEALSLLFVSCVPWISYSSIIQPTPFPPDSNPRITWGRYTELEGKTSIPVSVLCHHALVDGLHISKFYEALQNMLDTDFTAY